MSRIIVSDTTYKNIREGYLVKIVSSTPYGNTTFRRVIPLNSKSKLAPLRRKRTHYFISEFEPTLPDSYEIAKIFNTPTHQVVMLKDFEETRNGRVDDEEDEDFEAFEVSYSTSYQVKQIMYHRGVRIARAFGFEDEADRDECWAKMSQQQAQEFVDATVKFIEENSDEDSSK